VAVALYTGQRQADVLAMSRTKIRNGHIEVKQEKISFPSGRAAIGINRAYPFKTESLTS